MIATASINGPFRAPQQRTSLKPPGATGGGATLPAQLGRPQAVREKRRTGARQRPAAMGAVKHNVDEWVEANKSFFLPPICNKMMHSQGQLKVFYVGGPNVRPDYHLEEGEEFFYMLRGDMLLRVVEHGRAKDVVIREGEVFLLPGRIPHSPQRRAHTVGLVIERERKQHELDCMRFYQDDKCEDVLYERWLHCDDLTQGLAKLLNEFMSSEQRRTGRPGPGSFLRKAAYEPDGDVSLAAPFRLDHWLDEHKAELDRDGATRALFGPGHQSTIVVLGNGTHGTQCAGTETFLWQTSGSANVTVAGTQFALDRGDTLLVPSPGQYTLVNCDGGRTVATSMPPKHS